MLFNFEINLLTSAAALQALCSGVSHWLSLVLTLAPPLSSRASVTWASPMNAAAWRGLRLSESSCVASEESSSRMRFTSARSE